MGIRIGRLRAAWLTAVLLAAPAAFGWEQNLHRQLVLDALFLAPPEVRDYFTASGPCNIARYAENPDLPPLGQEVECGLQPAEERRKALEAARAALWAAAGPRAFDLNKLIHTAADAFCPAARLKCTADLPSFFEQHDINIFALGEGTFGELVDAFSRPPSAPWRPGARGWPTSSPSTPPCG
jgi:hypothetical protein